MEIAPNEFLNPTHSPRPRRLVSFFYYSAGISDNDCIEDEDEYCCHVCTCLLRLLLLLGAIILCGEGNHQNGIRHISVLCIYLSEYPVELICAYLLQRRPRVFISLS